MTADLGNEDSGSGAVSQERGVGVIIPAAGRGTRYGSAENKIWEQVGGRSLLEWTLEAFENHPRVAAMVLVGAPDELPRLETAARAFSKVTALVAGGSTRSESVRNGLHELPRTCDLVLVHDAARPAVSQSLISRVIENTEAFGAAIPGLPVSDTLKRVEDSLVVATVSREGLWAVQTPQGASRIDLSQAYEKLGERATVATDEAAILESAGYPVHMVMGESGNLKVTRPGDIERIKPILLGERGSMDNEVGEALSPPHPLAFSPPSIRTGFGYDVHQFAEGRPLWLGGVSIPHGRGLAGHSDADVLLHALCDALLGAAAMGDIGVLFPDTDAAHKDRPSIEFVHEVRRRLDEVGWSIVNVDIAVLAEEPRIGPYRTEMVAVIADSLLIAPTQVNIKATTSEKMGFVGRREGIACWAIATLSRS